jgi:hypothetical protein
MVKSLVISDLNRKILFLSCVMAGSVHDYEMMKRIFRPGSSWFKKISAWLDLGFLGADEDYPDAKIHLPYKKSRKSKNNPDPQLTSQQKNENRKQAATRVVVEHAIGGMKFFYCLTHRIRNHRSHIVDYFFSLSAGLWNYKIS